MEDNTLIIKTDDGKEMRCKILFTHHSNVYNKDYVVFVDDKNVASAAIYDASENGKGQLLEIKTEGEWNMLEKLLNNYNDSKEACSHDCSSCSGNCGSCSGSCDNCSCEEEE